jgi:hypothetical protein
MYNTLSGNSKGISLDNIKNRFITQGANKWSEAIYNEDIQYKYIDGYKMSKEESVYSDFKPEYLKMVAGTGAL